MGAYGSPAIALLSGAMSLRHPLLGFVGRRVFLGALTLLLVSVVVFAATQILPGDAARAVLGRSATPERLQILRLQLHLDRPALTQYWIWLSGLFAGDLGTSLVTPQGIYQLAAPRIANSFSLLVIVGAIGVPVAVALGIAAAIRRNRAFDTGLSVVALAMAAVPEFVIGIGLIILFATVVLHWLPPVSLVPPGTSVWARPRILVLPTLTLVIAVFPYIFRMMRSSMIEVLESEYIEMARLKGMGQRRLILRHALPNAIAPTVQVIALTFAYLAGGVVVVEYVFGFPGIGQGLVNAVFTRDIPMIQFIVVLLAAFYVAVNITADVVVVLVTPKLRTGAWQRS
jgi:peptide/nickel transport system permease protein